MTFRVQVTAMGSYLPDRVLTNHELAEAAGIDHDWVVQRTGIERRRWVRPGVATSDLAVAAGREALSDCRTKVDTLILATATPDHSLPASAPHVAHRLGLGDVTAFDIAAVCTGFVYGLAVGVALVEAGLSRGTLLIGADVFSLLLHPSHRDAYPLFGDGAGAWVLAPANQVGPGSISSIVTGSDGGNHELIQVRAGGSRVPQITDPNDRCLTLQGRAVFQNAVRRMAEAALAALDRAGLTVEAVTWVLAHQANLRILNAIADRLKIPVERFVANIADVGNTAAASIPLLSCSPAMRERAKPDDTVLVLGFGAGLTWGAAVLSWPEIFRNENRAV